MLAPQALILWGNKKDAPASCANSWRGLEPPAELAAGSYQCSLCGAPLGKSRSPAMNVLPKEKQVQIISALVEGNSIRSIERMTGVHRDTIMRLLVRTGRHCASI